MRAAKLTGIVIFAIVLTACESPTSPSTGNGGTGSGGGDSLLIPSTIHLYVDDDATAGAADGSVSAPFPTIQEAVDAASDNDVIAVAEGTYGQVQIAKPLSLYGGFNASFTNRNIAPSGSVVEHDGTSFAGALEIDGTSATIGRDSVVDGFVIRHTGPNARIGVNVDSASPTIRNNRIENTGAASGESRGVYTVDSGILLENNEIYGLKEAAGTGVGVSIQDPVPTEGLTTEITDNLILGADSPLSDATGTGLFVGARAEVRVVDTTVTAGTVSANDPVAAIPSYGVRVGSSGSVELYNSIVSAGTFEADSATAYSLSSAASAGNVITAYNNTFYAGDAGTAEVDLRGVEVTGTLTFVNNLFVRGRADTDVTPIVQFFAMVSVTLENNAYYDDGSGTTLLHEATGTATSASELNDASISAGGTDPVVGANVIADPAFADAVGGDFSLTAGSPPSVTTGGKDVSSVDAALSTDRAGDPRPGSDGQWSIGAYEAP